MMREMYQFLFPHIDEKGYYEFGSDSSFGPTIEALYGLFDIIITKKNSTPQWLRQAQPPNLLLHGA
jgi:hypothetical protein